MKQELAPSLEDLRLECVLVQAWKKTCLHLRQHNWYADTLEVDYESLRLPSFIREVQLRLEDGQAWKPSLIRVVPAPKSQKWRLVGKGIWEPKDNLKDKLRPLAHVSLPDQVLATAMMMCLADRAEVAQGDPRLPTNKSANRRRVLSYGHRLFCDTLNGEQLRHRWGSSKLYRQYYDDYRVFLKRPEIVVEELKKAGVAGDREIAIVHADLSKFYDRVKPGLLHNKVRALQRSPAEEPFFQTFERLFDWNWLDTKWAARYAKVNAIEGGFEHVSLPQGLVAAGFFANIVLLAFDDRLRSAFGKSARNDDRIILCDACRYVDDVRLVVQIPKQLGRR